MNLVEIFLPLTDNEGRRFESALFAGVCAELTEQFGGLTSFSRAPAHGVSDRGGKRTHDEIVVLEVMTEVLDPNWWSNYRLKLEDQFSQNEILIRASMVTKL